MNEVLPGSVAEAVEVFLDGLGGRSSIERVVAETVRATGRRQHPGWGTLPAEPENVAEFLYDLVQDLRQPRYRLSLS